jgi:hypothetical protein
VLKAVNITPAGWTAEARTFVEADPGCAVVTWAPPPVKLFPGPDLSTIDESQCVHTDEVVAWAHRIKRKLFICSACWYPDWAMPLDPQSTDGLFAVYMEFVMRRWRRCIYVPLNEPNFHHPQIPPGDAAEMMKVAAGVAAFLGRRQILGPAATRGKYSAQYLEALAGWRRPTGVLVGLAQHQYRDVHTGGVAEVQHALDALTEYRPEAWLWLTEGGHSFQTKLVAPDTPWQPGSWQYVDLDIAEASQAENVAAHFNYCKSTRRVGVWANYELRDSMHYGWASGLLRNAYAADGAPHPVRDAWLNLRGSGV